MYIHRYSTAQPNFLLSGKNQMKKLGCRNRKFSVRDSAQPIALSVTSTEF